MKVQIYAHKTPEDAVMSAASGVDFVGVSTGERGRIKGEVPFATCRDIFSALPDGKMKVVLTIVSDLEEIIETVEAVQPDVIHLSGDLRHLPASSVAELRKRKPLVKIMQAIPVSGEEAIDLALDYQSVCDYLLLDTSRNGFAGVVGATGATHDWRISAEIVKQTNIPVILAGGLHAENVAEAIRVVRPWGVDSLTHTNIPGTKQKDPVKVKDFVAASRQTNGVRLH